MHTIFDTISLLWDGARRPSARPLGLVILTFALLSAGACRSDSPTEADSSPTTTTLASTSPAAIATATTTATSASATSLATPTTTVVPVARPTATIDQLVGPYGAQVHVRCVGQGDTTVLLIAGFGGDSTIWAQVEPAITTRARVCSYDRLGTGTSDPATSPATFTTQAKDLHALLNTVGEPGPYIVVGHSFGGAAAVTFASAYADDVTGLVLIDAPSTTWPAALCAVADDGSAAAATVRDTCSTVFLPTGNSERLDVNPAFAEVESITTLGSLPTAVLTATVRGGLPDGLAAPEVARLTETWNRGQQDWLALSTVAHLVAVEHTGHHIEIDQPGVVIDEITRLLP
jgi:pimeloyl-ACP methyl ester carboxylesterase